MFDSTRSLRLEVARHAASFDADRLTVADAAAAVAEWSSIESIAATAKAMAAARVAASSAWKASGAPTAADWLARTTGTSAARAREQLSTGERLRHLEATASAALAGTISPAQAGAIADTAVAVGDPGIERRLLDAAGSESLTELRQRCARARAAADADPDATAARIHAGRCLRRWAGDDGFHHLHASGPAAMLARVDAALRPLTEAAFAAARASGSRDPHDAYAFDALVALADDAADTDRPRDPPVAAPQPATRASGRRTRHRAVIRVDLDALVRGAIAGDEVCEIAGLGPIPVSIARSLLGESTLHLVLTRGVDVANVTYLGRGPSAAQRIALLWQMPTCSRLGCNRTARLEIDHRVPYASDRVTRLANLDPLCTHDHALKTRDGWALVAGTGKRPFVPPDHPDHPDHPDRPGGAAAGRSIRGP